MHIPIPAGVRQFFSPRELDTARRELESPQLAQDEAELLDLVDQRYRYARQAKEFMLETWATCLAFFVGEQWRKWDDKTKRLVRQTRIPSWRVLAVYNQLPGITDLAASKLTRARELPRARPDEPDDPEDAARAARGTQALRAWWHRGGMDLTEHEANVNRIILGAAFLHLYWDPRTLGKVPVLDPRTGQPRATYAPVGDAAVEVLSVFDVFPEPGERYGDASWLIIARRKPLWWLREVFGERGAQVKREAAGQESAFSALIPGFEGVDGGLGAAPAPEGDGCATLRIYYQRPSREFPHGRTVYTAGETLLFRQDALPLPTRGVKQPLPVKISGYRYVPKRLWPKGLIEECISPQRELNRGLGNLAEIMRLYRSPKRWVDVGWRVKKTAITSSPDELVEGHFGGTNPAAYVEQPPNLPPWLAQYASIQREEMRHTAGQHEVSEGGVPASVTAASAIALLQQSENERLSSPALLGKVALEELAQHLLAVQAERYRERRYHALPTRAGGQQVDVFAGEELGPLEVVVEITDGVQDTDTFRQEQVRAWMSVGLFRAPVPFQVALLNGVGQGWLADVIQQAQPAIEAEQAAQALQAQAAAAENSERQAEEKGVGAGACSGRAFGG